MDGKKKEAHGLTPCGARVRAEDPARFLLGLFAPRAVRPAFWAICALDLETALIRRRVTEKTMGLIRLQWWRDSITRIYETGQAGRHEILEALRDVIRLHGVALQDFEALLDARERDLERGDAPFETVAALESHVLAMTRPWVAMTLKCTGGDVDETDLNRICTAWGLVVGLRALPADLRRGYHILPMDLMSHYGIFPDLSNAETSGPDLAPPVRELTGRAQSYLENIQPSAPVPCAMAGLIRQNLMQMERLNYNVFSPRMGLPPAFSALRLWGCVVFRKML